MIGFLRWLFGWSEFKIFGDVAVFITKFKNNIWMVNCEKKGVLISRCLTKDFAVMEEFARKNCCVLKKHKDGGFLNFIKKYKFRSGIFIGIFIVIITFLISNFLIWDVSVLGNVTISDEQVLEVCDKNGLYPGSNMFNFNGNKIECKLRELFPQIAWISINRAAGKYTVKIVEADLKPEIVKDSTPCNIVASFSGKILSANIFNGMPLVKAGDIVTRGQLLVSGVQEFEDKDEVIYSHSDAKIVALVERKNIISNSKNAFRKQRTGQTQVGKNLILFGLKVPLQIENLNKNAVKINEYFNPIKVLGVRLPILIKNEIYETYDTVDISDDVEQHKRLLVNKQKNWEQKELVACKILDRQYSFEEDEKYYYLKSSVLVEQRIDEKHLINMPQDVDDEDYVDVV